MRYVYGGYGATLGILGVYSSVLLWRLRRTTQAARRVASLREQRPS